MISQIIINPRHNENIATANTDFTVDLAIINMATGNYTSTETTYMSAPQQLDPQGLVYGHTHITIQVVLPPNSANEIEFGRQFQSNSSPRSFSICVFPGNQRRCQEFATFCSYYWRITSGVLSGVYIGLHSESPECVDACFASRSPR